MSLPIEPSRSERALLASVHRWARTNGWRRGNYGWINGPADEPTVNVSWSGNEIGFARAIGQLTVGPCWSCSTWIRVASVVQAVDVLVALDILPAWLSSPWVAAEDRYREQVEALEEELARKDQNLTLAGQTIAAQAAEIAELRPVAARAQFAAIGGAA